jgi:DNA polymerase, archaea type
MARREDEWVWGWDSTPGIVSVWAEIDGHATVWRRMPSTGGLVREEQRFRPWLLLDRLEDLVQLGERIGPEGCEKAQVTYRELNGPGSLRYLVSAKDGRKLISAVLEGATRRLGQRVSHLRDLGKDVRIAVVIVVARRNAHAERAAHNARLLRHVGKRSVAIVLV